MFNPYQSMIDQLKEKMAQTEALSADPELGALAAEELEQLKSELAQLEQSATEYESQLGSTSTAGEAHVNCTIEIRGGVGGDEAKIWASDLLRMYVRYTEIKKLKVEYLDDTVIKVKGKTTLDPNPYPDSPTVTAYDLFKFESGVHRVQRVPATESQGRIHTSTASVAVLPEVKETEIVIRDEDLEWQFMRAGGAGGQHVNKTSSAVRLTHIPSGFVTTSQQEKRQDQNRKIALELLRAKLWEAQEEKRLAELGEVRSVIGQARRAEKIRTYNYPQNRVTDHRTKQSWHNLDTALEGYLDTMMSQLHAAFASGEPGDTSEESDDGSVE